MTANSPKNFMKQRRPKRFSDSKIIKESKLNRVILEQHLGSLGARKQEKDFEEFARKLCQYEICPNLIPQTGSTGGGDSKVDTENTPVASQLQDFYFEGEDNQSKERLGFAFSTQKDWRTKVKGDIKKISETGRGYSKVFFITSEFAKDSTRAALEDELSKAYSFQVVIRDKSWILDKIFGNKRELLAIEELKMGDGFEEKKEVGPLDYQRKKQFEELNLSIEADVNASHVTLKTVDDSLDTALLASELEEPRSTVEGLFKRAIRVSKEHGTSDQHFTALYQEAWTTFFWFEDIEAFLKLYDVVEELAINSNNIYSTERLNNLWNLLSTAALTSTIIPQDLLKEKNKKLKEKLYSFKNNEANSSASVQAESMLCFLNLMEQKENPSEISKTFQELKSVVDKANNLIGFPFDTTFQLLNELDVFFSGQETYEELQEHLVEVVGKREGDLSAGNLLLNRGVQHMKAGRIYKAIDCLGRALKRFYKKESKDRLVQTLFFLSIAYEDAGLLWAARGALLNAASHATSDFWLYTEINTMQVVCYKRLKTVELRLGRIGYALEWHYLHLSLASQLVKTEEERNKLLDESLHFGSLMGLLVIKTPDQELEKLEKLPDVLMNMDLDFAGLGLMYRLGGKELFPTGSFLETMPPEEVDNFFSSYLSQPAQDSIPDKPSYYLDSTVVLKSSVLGCDFIVKTSNESPEIEIGEYILTALESFLSTSIDMGAVARDGLVEIEIIKDVELKEEIKYEIKKDGKFGVLVTSGVFNPHSLSKESQMKISETISEIVLQLVGNIIIFKDPDIDLPALFRDEEVSSRAFSFSTPLVTLGNVLGYNPRRSISAWFNEKDKSYPYNNEKSGRPIEDKNFIKDTSEDIENGKDKLKRHDEIKNVSVIRQHLWDEAGWGGVFYMTSEARPPVMAFLFKDEDKAKAIFKDWLDTFGGEDINEVIRISMIRGVSEKNPAWYRAVVSTNLDLKIPRKGHVITVSRVHTLTPETTENLDRFSESFKEFGVYLLAPAIIDDTKSYPRVLLDSGVVKREFIERQAWEIGPNDLDMAGIKEETIPIIPKDVEDAPVLKLIEKREGIKNKFEK